MNVLRQPHTAALIHEPDDSNTQAHVRLRNIADTLAAMFKAGEFNTAREDTRQLMKQLPLDLVDIAGRITPGRGNRFSNHPSVSGAIINALRKANTDADLAFAWDNTKALRLELPAAEQVLVVMSWIDQFTRLSPDNGQ